MNDFIRYPKKQKRTVIIDKPGKYYTYDEVKDKDGLDTNSKIRRARRRIIP